MRNGHIGMLVLRQNSDADLPWCNADGEGENDRGLMAAEARRISAPIDTSESLGRLRPGIFFSRGLPVNV